MHSKSRLLAAACHSVLFFASASVVAQEGRSTGGLEEIVVTAQKRSETLQDVPVAITAFTDELRDIVGITSIGDLTDFTPGLTYSLTQDRISLRGVGRLTNDYGSDPGVATYADGFYTASTVEAGKRPIIVDRIEILRGPQGTLYGRNSIGGAINVVSKRPTETFQGELRGTFGNYDTQVYEGAFSGPIADWLRFRVAGTVGGQGEGFFEDVDGNGSEGGKNDDLYIEGQLEFNVGDAVDGWFKYAHAEWDQARRTLVTITPRETATNYFNFVGATPGALSPNATFNGGRVTNNPAGPTNPLIPATPVYLDENPALRDRRLYDTDTPFRATLKENHIFILELVGHLGWADLKYVGGYQGYRYNQTSDFDNTDRLSYTTPAFTFAGTPLPIFTQYEAFYQEDKEYYSNEVNLISTGDGPLQWILGLYQYHEQVYQFSGYRSPLQDALATPRAAATTPTVFGPPNDDRVYQNAGGYLDADAHAVFGQVDWQFAEDWKLTFGARYTEDKKDADEFRTRVLYGLPGVPYAFYSEDNRRRKLKGDWNDTTGTFGIQWEPNDDTLAFAKYTRGYKSGGFTVGAFAASPYTDPESVNSYELGFKQTAFDRLTNNVSVFYYDYSDAQVPLTVLNQQTGLTNSEFFNLEKTESYGVELESVWAVTDALQARLTYGYLKTEIQDEGLCVVDSADQLAATPDAEPCALAGTQVTQFLNGSHLPSSPEHKVAANVNYTLNFSPGSLTLSGTWTWRDEAYYAVFSREHYKTPSYDEADFRLLWNAADSRYTVIGYVRNAFDDEGYERADASQAAWQVPVNSRSLQLGLTAPRTYGVELQYRFGQ